MDVYLSGEPDRRLLSDRLQAAASAAGIALPPLESGPLPARDWVAESEAALPPLRIGRFWVRGAHVDAKPPSGLLPLEIEASTAFGTGRHETTAGCLLALEALAERRRVRRALDMGCGSGILAIAMTRLWPLRVLAVDNDQASVLRARLHVRSNRASGIAVVPSQGYRTRAVARAGPYDLIVANILAGPLIAMALDLRRHLAPGGVAVLSGLLRDQERAVLARHRAVGLRLLERRVLGDWVTLVVGRRPELQADRP